MIRSFRSRALKDLGERDDRSKLDARMVRRILRRLDALHQAARPEDLNRLGFGFHELRRPEGHLYDPRQRAVVPYF
jgi:proteic killer suppression protein